jgi:hypothetical protein
MPVSPQQRAFFEEFGYLHVRRAFGPAEVAAICEEHRAALAPYTTGVNRLAGPGEEGHDGSGRTQISAFIQRRPRLCALLDDERVSPNLGGSLPRSRPRPACLGSSTEQ